MRKLLPALLLAANAALFLFALQTSAKKIGQAWESPPGGTIFTLQDYFLTVVPPAVSGILFVALGVLMWFFLSSRAGSTPLLLFHFFFGNFLIVLPGFLLEQEGFRYAFFGAAALLLLSAIYLALNFPSSARKPRVLLVGLGLGFALPLLLAIGITQGNVLLPGTLAAPLTLLFPLSLFLGMLMAELQQSRWQLVQKEKMATMGSLLAGLAHEINNPLTFIYSNIEPLRESVETLRKTLDDPEGKAEQTFLDVGATVNTMEEGATRAKDIIENLRHFAYPGRREKETVDLNSLLEQSIALLSPKWKGRLRIVRRFGNIPKIQGLAGDLGQVFLNILANACEATPKRGVVRIRTWLEEKTVIVAIRDSGMGIARETMARIFDPFFTTKVQGEGTGLGLAIALQIVQKHQGAIDVKSEPGKGAEVRVTLPLAAMPTAREREDAEEASIIARKEVTG